MELQQNLEKIRAQGLGVAAISYDPVATLKDFADRRGIKFPLLSDQNSTIIRAFKILNEEVPAGTPFHGIPYPGTYIVDRSGRVLSKWFEDDYTQRITTSDILVRQFGDDVGAMQTLQTKHLTVAAGASADHVRAGQRIALTLDIEMKTNMHVYAPGVQGYMPIEWSIRGGPPELIPHEIGFPKSTMLRLEAINETVPVFNGKFRLIRDITIGKVPAGPLMIDGTLKYQACDDRICYVPQTINLKWAIQVEPHDVERPPAPLRRKIR